jgi:hypothetical protein
LFANTFSEELANLATHVIFCIKNCVTTFSGIRAVLTVPIANIFTVTKKEKINSAVILRLMRDVIVETIVDFVTYFIQISENLTRRNFYKITISKSTITVLVETKPNGSTR